MLEKRVKIQSVVENQLPIFLGAELEGAGDFLKTYYRSQENQGAPVNILENIDQYTKVGTYSSIVGFTTVTSKINFEDTTINVGDTSGWPEKYGLLKINDEIISYTGKTQTTFTGCIRGFSGITSYHSINGPDELIFEDTESSEHVAGGEVVNLSSLFLKEFFRKLKTQFLPGLENTSLYPGLRSSNFLKQAVDLYKSKGTAESFEILFRALYNDDVEVIKPQDNLFKPSDAEYRRVLRLNAEPLPGQQDVVQKYLSGIVTKNVYQEDSNGNVIASGSVVQAERFVKDGKSFFNIDLDFSEDKDTSVFGSIYGEFKLDKQTKIIENVSSGSTFANVESTIGFPASGELQVTYQGGETGIVTYKSKTVNQFLDIDGITAIIPNKQEIFENTTSYGVLDDGEKFFFKIKGSLGQYNIKATDLETPYFTPGDVIKNQSLGYSKNNLVTDSLINNETSRFEIDNAKILNQNQLGQNPNIISLYQIRSKQPHDLVIGDSIEVITPRGLETSGVVNNILSDFVFDVSGLSGFDPTLGGEVRRILKKVNSQNSVVNSFTANVSKSFYDVNNSVYIASNSLPFYQDPINVKNGNVVLTDNGKSASAPYIVNGETIEYTDHGLYSGEEVYYQPDKFVELITDYGEPVAITTVRNLGDLSEGRYFVKRIDANNFKLAESRSNVFNNTFVDVTGIASNQVIYPIDSYENQLDSSYGIKKVPVFVEELSRVEKTVPGKVGLLINGVDILSYKSKSYCYYGKIESIDTLAGGSDYDVINPPNIIISDNIGSGATATASVTGTLNSIEVLDSGYDFISEPIITITGGNGRGAKAKANLRSEKTVAFVDVSSGAGNISTSTNVIGFSTYHRFRNGDGVVYSSNEQLSIGIGTTSDSQVRDADLVNNSIYYVNVRSLNEVTLHGHRSTALAGVGTINLTSFGEGNQYFTSVDRKNILSSVAVESGGEGYTNNPVKLTSSGISTSKNQINFDNHGFSSGELVKYSFEGSSISGLTTDQNYLVTRVDSNAFKLSAAGVGTTASFYNYNNGIFVDIQSVGTGGTHEFNYPPIVVSISGNTGIGTTNSLTFNSTIKPNFRGPITKINLQQGGIGYGCSNVLDFERQPLITFENGSSAQLKPIIDGGTISEVFVLNGGYGYNSAPTLKVSGYGQNASVTPVITNGTITSIKINNGGSGFSTDTTFIDVIPTGQGAKARVSIKSWNVNEFERKRNLLSLDDGILANSENEHSRGSYASMTVPRALREVIYSKNEDGSSNYGADTFDLIKLNGIEVPSQNHSPIIGWAYDGYPIYGPYGYSDVQGGSIVALESGYELDPPLGRPDGFPQGFFIEDYLFKDNGDLDEHNGRFAKTPDYPDGTYAYYATINPGKSASSGPFKNYKEPQFPYIIGDSYKAKPDVFNFTRLNNQVDFGYQGLVRNTRPSKTSNLYGYNEYINDSTRDIQQTSHVRSVSKGSIIDATVVSAGTSYKHNDPIYLDGNPKFGRQSRINVNRILGKKIVSLASSTITSENFELFVGSGFAIGYCTSPHNFENKNRVVISGLSTESFADLNGTQNIFNPQRIWRTNEFIDTPANTGLTTTIALNGPYDPLYVRENTIIGIGSSASNLEQMKVLNVDPLNSVIRVQRNQNGTVGTSYSTGTLALDIRSSFSFNVGVETFISNPPTFQRYFDPSEVVGLGTTVSVGIGTTISYHTLNNIAPPHLQENTDYQPGTAYTSRIIPIKTILIPNHSFETGDKLTYSNGGGTSIEVSDGIGTFVLSDQSTVYAIKESANLLGISTTKVGLGSTGSFVGLGSTAIQLAFTAAGLGVIHSFKAETSPVTADANVYEATLTTEEPHGLNFNDDIRLVPTPNKEQIVFVQYNDHNRRVVFDRKKFEPSGITSFTNTINIQNHGLLSGDKVIYTTGGSAPVGLDDQKMYYAIEIDSNNIKLAANKVDAIGNNPKPVSIGGTGSGEHFISRINPGVKVTRGNTVSFATTDSSLSINASGSLFSAFDLKFYTDSDYRSEFKTTKTRRRFEVTGIGTIGVTTPSAVNIETNESVPDKLFYKFIPINVDISPSVKTEVFTDYDQDSATQISLVNSVYQVAEYPTGIGTTTFKFNLVEKPEKTSYLPSEGSFYYTHKSTTATGPIDSINIKNSNLNYEKLPGITSIGSSTGSGGLVRLEGTMGAISRVEKNNTGYDYPSDPTLKVIANTPEILRVEELNSFSNIGITSGGKGYNAKPSLVVIDAITGNQIKNVVLDAEIKNGGVSKVNIRENAKNLSEASPSILTINNPNGVGVNTVGFNTITNEVTLSLKTGFSTTGTFPFHVGGKVFVEGVGIASTGSGYNSTDYNFKFFEVTEIDANIGGIGSVTYKLDSTVTNPGTYVTTKSSGRVIPFEFFPVFDPKLIKNEFSIDETVVIENSTGVKYGTVSNWDSKNKVLKINSPKEILVNDNIRGLGSGTIAKVSEKINVDSYYDIEADPLVILGWGKDTGKLSVNEQRIIDSDYYQHFSYSLKSKIAYDTWNDLVSSMNHTVGFKKFSDLQVESKVDDRSIVGVSSNTIDLFVELANAVETYCRYDFDYVSEDHKFISGQFLSDEILTKNVPIADFEESVGNRVLSIDSFQDEFNNTPRATPFSVIDTFPLAGTRYRKYFALTQDAQFLNERRMEVIELLIDNPGNGYIQEYAIVDGEKDLGGYYDFRAQGSEGQLLFFPDKFDTNDFTTHGLVYNVDRDIHTAVGISTLVGITTVGDIIQLATRGSKINAGVTTAVNIYSIPLANMDAGHKFMIQMSAGEKHEVINLNALHDDGYSYLVEYGNMSSINPSSTDAVINGIGTFGAMVANNIFYISCTPDSGVVGTGITFNIFGQCFVGGASTVGVSTVALTNGDVRAQYSDVPSQASPGITTIATFGNSVVKEEAAHVLVHVNDVTNDKFEMLEAIVMVDSDGETYQTFFGNVETDDDNLNQGIGTITTLVDGSDYNMVYVPPPLTNVRVKTLVTSAAQTQGGVDSLFELDLVDTKVDSFSGSYTNTQADVRRAFGLFHGGDPIFTKSFDSTDNLVVDLDNDIITIPNHFFTSGERLKYTSIGSGTTSSIGIGTTTISGYGSTDKLPEYVYAIKVDDKGIRLAGSAEDSLASNVGNYLNLTSVGIGTSHSLTSQDQNTKCIVTLDNNIQDPVIPLNIEYNLVEEMSFGGETIRISGITSIFGGDLLKVEDEFIKVNQVGFGSTNVLVVQRAWMGSGLSTHPNGAQIEKYGGAYNIVDNTINFYTAPSGLMPKEGTDPDDIDYSGIQTTSTFHGRAFLRNGVVGTSTHTYATNYLFDSVSTQFTGVGKTFTVTQDDVNVEGFSSSHALILINEIAQIPSQGSRINDFELVENAGITSVVFSGFAASVTNDVNTGSVPVGGVLVSVGSTQGFGYQPLVAAGGTANVSGFGTISSISIGNSGSGYRTGIATLNGVVQELTYNVGLRTADIDTVEVTAIGTATVVNGNVTGVSITNPGAGYTFSNPPIVVFDQPIPYTNIPLIYHPDSPGAQIGTNAFVDIQVSNNNTVLSFDITNNGYGYRVGEILTVPKGGVTGIPTLSISSTPIGFGTNNYKVEFAEYDAISGILTATIGVHTITTSDSITLVNESIIFSCSSDEYKQRIGYPRPTDPAAGTARTVTAVTSDTITFDVGGAQSGSSYLHKFVGAGMSDFRMSVNGADSDKFSGWRFGDFDVFDKLDPFFDGERQVFTMRKDGAPTSIRAQKGSLIDVEQTILVFLNNVLQEPGVAYRFNGGSNLTFTEPPKVGDTCAILFYRGTGAVDVISRDIIETIKSGDTVKINASDTQNPLEFNQDQRFVVGITTADSFRTATYTGGGLTTDVTIERPFTWCKQQEDLFIDNKPITKDRDLYTARIFPETHIIKPVGLGSTEIWVTSALPLFDSYSEGQVESKQTIEIYDQTPRIGAAATAIVSGFGTIASISVTNSGLGYTATPLVSIANSVGFGSATRATATASITGTAVTSISVSNAGAGYTFSNPPVVLITPPRFDKEEIKNVDYAGDYGIISGVGTTSVGVATVGLVFDLLIPQGSSLRSTSVMGPGAARTISNIATGMPFVVFDSNIGQGVTSLDLGGATLGIGSTCLDNVYEAVSVSVATTEAVGFGTTHVARVVVSVASTENITGYGFSQFFGRYSWGQLKTFSRTGLAKTFAPSLENGVVGISTGPVIVRRTPLKSLGYRT
jgi:hypothetical protein